MISVSFAQTDLRASHRRPDTRRPKLDRLRRLKVMMNEGGDVCIEHV